MRPEIYSISRVFNSINFILRVFNSSLLRQRNPTRKMVAYFIFPGPRIGGGGFGSVHTGTDKWSGQPVAIKRMKPEDVRG